MAGICRCTVQGYIATDFPTEAEPCDWQHPELTVTSLSSGDYNQTRKGMTSVKLGNPRWWRTGTKSEEIVEHENFE